jgi:T5SS/PEP-CTERM-associated repeat protein
VVTDPGSLWSHSGTWYVGYYSGGNNLIISNGAAVTGGNCIVSYQGRNNRVVVTGENSRLQVTAIGLTTSSNELWVCDGAKVITVTGSYLGQYGSNNLAWITDPGSLWTNSFDLYLGSGAHNNQLVVSNGAAVALNSLVVGDVGGSGQKVTLAGLGSLLTNRSNLYLGANGSSNQLFIADGAHCYNNTAYLGYSASTNHHNLATVTGPGSLWTNRNSLYIGYNGGFNQLVISNGGQVFAGTSTIGVSSGILGQESGTNSVVVSGAGSLWSNRTALYVGNPGTSNRLTITDGGTVKAPFLTMSASNGSTNNLVVVDGGNLMLTGTFTVQSGAAILNSGLIQVNGLTISGSRGNLLFNGGTLDAKSASINNGSAFQIGDGTNTATYYQPTTSTHSFTGGLIVSSNALLTGAGTINSMVTVRSGGTIAPGTSNILYQTLTSSLILSNGSFAHFELNAQSDTTTRIEGNPTVTLGGTLQLTNVQGTFAAGMAFQLFKSTNVIGAFAAITPPRPSPGLTWDTSGLTIDGTLRVANFTPTIPVIQNVILGAGFSLHADSGIPYYPCLLLTSTNLSDWEAIATHTFDSAGNLNITNQISASDMVRFYKLQLVTE